MKHFLLCIIGLLCGLQIEADVPPRDRLLGKQGQAWVEQGEDFSQYNDSVYKEADDLSSWRYSQWRDTGIRRVGSQGTAPLKSKAHER